MPGFFSFSYEWRYEASPRLFALFETMCGPLNLACSVEGRRDPNGDKAAGPFGDTLVCGSQRMYASMDATARTMPMIDHLVCGDALKVILCRTILQQGALVGEAALAALLVRLRPSDAKASKREHVQEVATKLLRMIQNLPPSTDSTDNDTAFIYRIQHFSMFCFHLSLITSSRLSFPCADMRHVQCRMACWSNHLRFHSIRQQESKLSRLMTMGYSRCK